MSGLRTDYPVDRLRMVHEALAAFNSNLSENPELGDALETLEAIASALYGAESGEPDTARDDAIDAMHADPELNAVADLRTLADAFVFNSDTTRSDYLKFGEHAAAVVELCDAYIGLRAQCPPGAVVVTAPQLGNLGPVRYTDDNGDPTTLFDKVVGALDFSEVYAQIIEVK